MTMMIIIKISKDRHIRTTKDNTPSYSSFGGIIGVAEQKMLTYRTFSAAQYVVKSCGLKEKGMVRLLKIFYFALVIFYRITKKKLIIIYY